MDDIVAVEVLHGGADFLRRLKDVDEVGLRLGQAAVAS